MTPTCPHTRLRLRALRLYALGTLAFAVPYLVPFMQPLAYLVCLAVAVPVALALAWVNAQPGERRWIAANWRALAGKATLYFATIGVGVTLLLAYRHPVTWAGGAVVLAGGAAHEWLRVKPPQPAR